MIVIDVIFGIITIYGLYIGFQIVKNLDWMKKFFDDVFLNVLGTFILLNFCAVVYWSIRFYFINPF